MPRCIHGDHECVVGVCPSSWPGEYEGRICQPSNEALPVQSLSESVELAYMAIWPAWDAYKAGEGTEGALHDAINALMTLAREGAKRNGRCSECFEKVLGKLGVGLETLEHADYAKIAELCRQTPGRCFCGVLISEVEKHE